NRVQSAADVLRHGPDLALLPAGDREVVARALHRDPGRRFDGCAALVRALAAASPRKDRAREAGLLLADLPPVITWPGLAGEPTPAIRHAAGLPELGKVLPQLIAGAAGPVEVLEHQRVRFLMLPGKQVQHRCAAWLPPGVGRLKLASFCREWAAEVLQDGDD